MTTKRMLLLTGALSAVALTAVTAGSADLQPMVVGGLTGTLRIQQGIPCADDVDQTTPITAGRLELTPSQGVDVIGGKRFALSRVSVSFAAFSIHRDCLGFGDTRSYTDIGVQLAHAVSFTALETSPGVFAVTIPKEQFQIYEAAVVNGSAENGYKSPKQDVTGTIDFGLGSVTMHVVIATKVHFQAGCTILGCIINEDKDGTLTADVSGTIVFPDTDRDGVPDRTDNCRFTPNPDQTPVATPVVTAPPAITVASCADHAIGSAAATDVCDAGPVTVTNNAPTTFLRGPNVVTWRGQDGVGRFVTALQTVTVVDTTSPIFTFVPPNIAVNTCGPVALGTPTAIDDCAGTPTFTNNAPPKFFVGATVVTWTAHDVAGNTATETQTVTVTDTVPPTVACVPAGPPGGTFQASASDACDTPIIRLGTFVLANGERIKINETGQPGVTFVGYVGPDHIRHFHVGKGEAVITATDASSNVASALCR